jgi:hypothetical protein
MTTYHTVGPGENLSLIARKYGLKSWKDIYRYDANSDFCNKRPNENLIFPGDVVVIPDGAAPTKTASVPAKPALTCDSKAAAVAILKTSAWLDANTKALLSPALVSGIIAAEAERLSFGEGQGGLLDGDTCGPGQIGEPLYTDVLKYLKPELNQFLVHMGTTCGGSLMGRGCGVGKAPLALHGFPQDVVEPVVSDFFIAAGLAVKVKGALKPGRSAEDQLRFGIALYHCKRDTISAAQAAISPADKGASVLAYAPVKAQLESSTIEEVKDVPLYVDDVLGCPQSGCGPCRLP